MGEVPTVRSSDSDVNLPILSADLFANFKNKTIASSLQNGLLRSDVCRFIGLKWRVLKRQNRFKDTILREQSVGKALIDPFFMNRAHRCSFSLFPSIPPVASSSLTPFHSSELRQRSNWHEMQAKVFINLLYVVGRDGGAKNILKIGQGKILRLLTLDQWWLNNKKRSIRKNTCTVRKLGYLQVFEL